MPMNPVYILTPLLGTAFLTGSYEALAANETNPQQTPQSSPSSQSLQSS